MLKKLENYISSRILLLKIEGTEKVSKTLAVLLKRIVLLMFLGSFVFFLSVAIGLYIGDLYNSYIIGFSAVAGLHLLLLLLLYLFRKPLIERPVKDEIVRTAFKDVNDKKK
ncbi:MAG: hypothetical protein K9I29_04130 [Bacteroidales bacterium]|nr:hypothetical protein [Bacteroidales bacterium]MCF8327460.1 hypothetical protein [Bacteroidales bacterium]